jgi:hypothetical protein
MNLIPWKSTDFHFSLAVGGCFLHQSPDEVIADNYLFLVVSVSVLLPISATTKRKKK